jgi:NADH-quinone oxidoreductase subunit J
LEGLGFYVFGALTLFGAAMMVFARNPLYGVLWLVVSFLGLAGLFGGLDAHFLAAVQILVYAGAILVLFLFVIMLLNLRLDDVKHMPSILGHGGMGALLVGVAGFLLVVGAVVRGSGAFKREVGSLPPLSGGTAEIAVPLFRDALLPFEVVSILLLAAIVGSVALTKRRLP